ncbi:Acyl-[acyl-carrier-protein] desaturase 5, chloroplastic [Auxenochlorella protothecoides]|uniref:Acyl-[acyl-carrier-protein] desaturase 5, chloroplastic n=2 Tax=Auxenochlorella protothecoides TaxID=3075 RepID=A0A087SQR0_AUXPR|nr:Acyl-[acyl-carrier-protein] desaturase 5, chloroplastic [Auxenochlorella protothecoides]KFM28064.1 Acyl-[acyl-carrier-protein] desaturase 5, chloroplastic [Auxenochlorella protothecoides]RMZ54032.1 hypothetical protein APUTEX25_002609 [Auxenochlorella protothecoides]|eukprot:RMZ54032.1 hypothetical protein APUTEX25_002609 [Auxenochlorella protothecoides]
MATASTFSAFDARCGDLRRSAGSGPRRPARPLPVRAAIASEVPVATTSPRPGPTVYSKLDKAHTLTPERMELINGMSAFAEERILPVLQPVEKLWQPQDLLPDPESPDFLDQVAELRARAANVPDDYFVVLVGDMITEEALPTYMAMLNTLDGVRDETGAADHPWGRWTRQWVAEENRHGDLLNKYCWLTGRVNMKAIEVTIQNLIGSGMNPKTENNPYLGFVYTSFQERATKYSHGNTARLAAQYGDATLSKVCGVIAADEGRHEIAYTRIVEEFFRLDPEGAMSAYADMMRKQITMPAHLMDDQQHGTRNTGRNLFADFSAVTEKLDVYDAEDYCKILEHLNSRWKIADRTVSGDAGADQEYVLRLPSRFRKLAEKSAAKRAKTKPKPVAFSWLSGREVMV